MPSSKPTLLLFVLILLPSLCLADSQLDIRIDKSGEADWVVTYDFSVPAIVVHFARNPDDSRAQRWTPLDTALEIGYENGMETIRRKDGAEFYTASFRLTPTYQHLPKDYAPFSPFSDGGTLLHSGRFFACVESCKGVDEWRLSLSVPKGEHILLDAGMKGTSAEWVDQGDGRSVYVGTQTPVESNGFVSVIDQGLPDVILAALETDLPKMLAYFERSLSKLETDTAPTLFASYAKVPGSSTQGGVLPGQIFIHWNVNDLESNVNDQTFIADTLWTFAHEAAHFYQTLDGVQTYAQANQAWVHEGNAEMMAALALLKIYPDFSAYVEKRFEAAESECQAGLNTLPLAAGDFGMQYRCGLMIHRAIHDALTSKADSNASLFSVWRAYQQRLRQQEPAGKATFIKAAEEFMSTKQSNTIFGVVEQPVKQDDATLQVDAPSAP